MKKQLALLGATTLGLSAVALAAPTAAFAADAPLCADSSEHDTPSGGDNTYLACTPQYGLGKVEFTLESDIPLPPEFAIPDPSVTTSTASTPPAAQPYFEADPNSPNGFAYVEEDARTTTQVDYHGSMIFQITSFQPTLTPPPASCTPNAETPDEETYEEAYVVTYLPTTVNTTTTVNGEVWNYTITATPSPLYLYLNLDDDGDLDQNAPQCATDGTSTTLFAGDGEDSGDDYYSIFGHAVQNPLGETIDPFFGDDDDEFVQVLGSFVRLAPVELATTGVNPALPAALAGGLGVLGLSLVLIRRRFQTRG